MLDPKNELTISELVSCDVRTSTLTGTAFDLKDYIGNVAITLISDQGTGNANNTLDCKIQSSSTSGGSYADVSGATFTQVTGSAGNTETISVDTRSCSRYIKLIGTMGGTSPSYAFGAIITGRKQVQG
jgi:hypothetical protein